MAKFHFSNVSMEPVKPIFRSVGLKKFSVKSLPKDAKNSTKRFQKDFQKNNLNVSLSVFLDLLEASGGRQWTIWRIVCPCTCCLAERIASTWKQRSTSVRIEAQSQTETRNASNPSEAFSLAIRAPTTLLVEKTVRQYGELARLWVQNLVERTSHRIGWSSFQAQAIGVCGLQWSPIAARTSQAACRLDWIGCSWNRFFYLLILIVFNGYTTSTQRGETKLVRLWKIQAARTLPRLTHRAPVWKRLA